MLQAQRGENRLRTGLYESESSDKERDVWNKDLQISNCPSSYSSVRSEAYRIDCKHSEMCFSPCLRKSDRKRGQGTVII